MISGSFLFNSIHSLLRRAMGKLQLQKQKLSKILRKYKKQIKKETFLKNLSDVGIKKDDTLLVHSSLSKIGNVFGGPQTIIDALIEKVGCEGNVVMPAYSYIKSMVNTSKEENYIFDSKETPSIVGIITEIFRKKEKVERSIHPTHSVCAYGLNANEIVNGHLMAETNFGINTPFHKIKELKGKIVGLGISIGPVTIYHMLEDFFPAKFNGVYLPEQFPIKVKLDDGIALKYVSIHDPKFHTIRIDKSSEIENWFKNHLKEKNILHEGIFGAGNIWWMDIQQLFEELLVLKNEGISIYSVPKN